MRRRRRGAGSGSDIDMTPMLDIVFILLIFFIVTATLEREHGIDMRPPPEDPEAPEPVDPPPVIVVQVDEGNTIFINQLQTDIARVSARIERFRSDNPKSPVLIDANPSADHGVIVQIWDQAKAVGAAGVSIQVNDGEG